MKKTKKCRHVLWAIKDSRGIFPTSIGMTRDGAIGAFLKMTDYALPWDFFKRAGLSAVKIEITEL